MNVVRKFSEELFWLYNFLSKIKLVESYIKVKTSWVQEKVKIDYGTKNCLESIRDW